MLARQILDYALPLLPSDYRRLQLPSTVLQPCNGEQSFNKKRITDEIKFTAIKDEICSVLSMDELRSMKITNLFFRIEAIIFCSRIVELSF